MISCTMLARAASILTTRRSTGSSSTTTVAPSTVPVRFPIPPKITIAKIVNANANPNTLGVASCSHAASSPPANAASAEVMPNTATL